ncbi:MAG TPA: RES family NAD+ phosphorylase [Nocardioides sp.]|uniref:RES family NAD+ phosphorylase n=1 Tax=Nocardioides sp. TaxID=35761 RepID=UPI002BB3F8A5|nr:RES family NAD+ phosphorylase [Nocardioides sp.]HTW17286.1 RES family NAD+ phosphorylase [Nocardioides sp.]
MDIDLYRGRLFEGEAPTMSEMGAPPAEKAAAGRANPVGIPYLYLAYSRETCLYEARATTLSKLAVGRFQPTRQLSVLNLADIEPPDFFSLFEVESIEAQISRAAYHRYLTSLGEELRKPIRSSDRLTDYIPTQYLCEMAKSIGLDGVLYSSSLDPAGRNLVLFDVQSCECVAEPEIIEVTAVSLNWHMVPSL